MSSDVDVEFDGLPTYVQWRAANTEQLSLIDFLYGVSNVEVAVAFTKLFWPELIEHAGGVFLADGFDLEGHATWVRELKGAVREVERMMNHRHVEDLLPGADAVSDRNREYLGQTLAAMWRARLANTFPGRSFEVHCRHDETGTVVTFIQAPAPTAA